MSNQDNKESGHSPALASATRLKAESEATAYCLCILVALVFCISACIHAWSRYRIEETARFDTPGWAHDVALADNKIYVSDRQAGLLVFRRDQGLTSPQVFTPVADVISLAPRVDGLLLAARFEGLVQIAPDGAVLGRLACENEIANYVSTPRDLAFVAFGLAGAGCAQAGD